MAGTIAYGEITILDLIDTATYIYYAEDENGSGASLVPESTSNFIGIYSGNPIYGEQAQLPPPDSTVWSKYTGRGISETILKYQVSESGTEQPENWEDVAPNPDDHKGKYLWTKIIFKYDEGEESVSYSVSYIAKDANAYYIETNQEEILRFTVGENKYTFSPEVYWFKIYDLPMTENSTPRLDFNYDLVILLEGAIYIQTKDTNAISGKEYYRYTRANGADVYNKDTTIKSGDDLGLKGNLFEIYTNSTYSLVVNAANYVTKGRIVGDSNTTSNPDTVFFFAQNYVDSLVDGDGIKKILTQDKSHLKFSLLNEEEEEVAIKPFDCRNGVGPDLAELNVNAANIVAAIQETKLQFSADGLLVQNGGFRIQNNSGTDVFWADSDGDLTLTGTIEAENGYFKGELKGASGDFIGKITANEGEIGGFVIKDNRLHSLAVDEQQNSLIVLDGGEGNIIAKNIALGEGANITDFIQLGDAFLYNPKVNNGKLLESGGILLTQTGHLNLGTIQAYGGQRNNDNDIISPAYIQSQNGKWKIWETGTAEFEDIYANNVHLQNTILEIGTVQSVGSLMLFKDSWVIEQITDTLLVLNGLATLQTNDWIYCGNEVYKIATVSSNNGKTTLTLSGGMSGFKGEVGKIVSKFGQATTEAVQGGFVLSALGEDTTVSNSRQFRFASGNSITLADFSEVNGILEYRKRLVLGSLTGLTEHTSGIGLYCDNVFLEGALVTTAETGRYAGINTLNPTQSSEFKDSEDDSRVILWAGASNLSDVGSAPFHVTEGGSVYAQRAKFSDSIFAGGTITGTNIYAAKIFGIIDEPENPSLEIYDSKKGISFKYKDGNNEYETFSISQDGLKTDSSFFVKILNNEAQFLGSKFDINSRNGATYLSFDEEGLSLKTYSDQGQSDAICSLITPKQDGVVISVSDKEGAVFKSQKTEIKTEWTQLNKNVQFGTNQYLQYQQTDNGYDLYVLG